MPPRDSFPVKEEAPLWNGLYLVCRIWQFEAWYRPIPCLSEQPGPQRPNAPTARLQSCASRAAFGGSLKAPGCMTGHRRSKFAATSTDAWNAEDTSTQVCRESNGEDELLKFSSSLSFQSLTKAVPTKTSRKITALGLLQWSVSILR